MTPVVIFCYEPDKAGVNVASPCSLRALFGWKRLTYRCYWHSQLLVLSEDSRGCVFFFPLPCYLFRRLSAAPALCGSCLIGHSLFVARPPPPAPAADEWLWITDEDTLTRSTFPELREGRVGRGEEGLGVSGHWRMRSREGGRSARWPVTKCHRMSTLSRARYTTRTEMRFALVFFLLHLERRE